MLRVRHPLSRGEERRYVIGQMLGDWLGLDIECLAEDRVDTVIEGPDGTRGPQLKISDGLLCIDEARWLAPDSLPKGPAVPLAGIDGLDATRLVEGVLLPPFPCRYGAPAALSGDASGTTIDADLFGATFFFLTRYEEIAAPVADRFGRFPASASWAGSAGLIGRPLVDEYLALLRAVLLRLWPQLSIRSPDFRVEVSHDVDLPLRHAWSPAWRMAAGGARDLWRGGSLKTALERVSQWHAVRHRGQFDRDPYNTFDELMRCSEQLGRPAAFYFIADRPLGSIDALYEIDDPFIAGLIGRLHRAGHEIGLHPSFGSHLDPDRLRRELKRLQTVCDAQGVRQPRWGGRQHYLRWQAPDTWAHWDAVDLAYDSTLGFAEQVGFRCGTSREFRVFDARSSQHLDLIERPLIVMDTTLLNYMGLGATDAAVQAGLDLKRQCRIHDGVFSLLWHNSNLTDAAQWRSFRALLSQ